MAKEVKVMQVKIFKGFYEDELEKKINDFLNEDDGGVIYNIHFIVSHTGAMHVLIEWSEEGEDDE